MLQELIAKTSDPAYRFSVQEKFQLLNEAPDVFHSLPPRVPALLARVEPIQKLDMLIIGYAGIGEIAANLPARIEIQCFEPDPLKQQIGRVLLPRAKWSDLDIARQIQLIPIGVTLKKALICRPPTGSSVPYLSRLGPLQYTGHLVALRYIEAITRKAPPSLQKYFILPHNLAHAGASMRKFTRESKITLDPIAQLEDFVLVLARHA